MSTENLTKDVGEGYTTETSEVDTKDEFNKIITDKISPNHFKQFFFHQWCQGINENGWHYQSNHIPNYGIPGIDEKYTFKLSTFNGSLLDRKWFSFLTNYNQVLSTEKNSTYQGKPDSNANSEFYKFFNKNNNKVKLPHHQTETFVKCKMNKQSDNFDDTEIECEKIVRWWKNYETKRISNSYADVFERLWI
jgi:hypothetical protein